MKCPICLDEPVEFHHWDYENNQGVYICRPCHNAIHDGGARPGDSMGASWLDAAISNLIELHLERGRPPDPNAICELYNIPFENIGIVGSQLVKRGEIDTTWRNWNLTP